MSNAEQRVGRGKIRSAIHGRGSFGEKLSDVDRKKLLRSGGEDLVKGNAKENKRKAKKAASAQKPYLSTK